MFKQKTSYFATIIVITVFYLLLYFLLLSGMVTTLVLPPIVDICIFIFLSLSYLLRYRKYNLLCFELFFLPIFFIGAFFQEIVLNNLDYIISGIAGAFDNYSASIYTENKCRGLQFLAFLFFILGCSISNEKRVNYSENWDNFRINGYSIDYKLFSNLFIGITFLFIVICYLKGDFNTWFSYSQGLSESERNQSLGHLDAFCLISTVLEFTRLASKGVNTLRVFIKKCNKLYLFEVLLLFLLLFLSGNRNESLLILLPAVVAYSIFIQQIPSRLIIVALFCGSVAMVGIGLTRSGDSLNTGALDILSLTMDFSVIDINTEYLIDYTDNKGAKYLSNIPATIFSSIPYVGPRLIESGVFAFAESSAVITTDGMVSYGSETGLGTSLVGDVYFTGKSLFVIIFMWFLGYFICNLYNRFYYKKKFNIYIFLIYIYMVANAVYYVRSPWDFMISTLLYDIILIWALSFLFHKKLKR